MKMLLEKTSGLCDKLFWEWLESSVSNYKAYKINHNSYKLELELIENPGTLTVGEDDLHRPGMKKVGWFNPQNPRYGNQLVCFGPVAIYMFDYNEIILTSDVGVILHLKYIGKDSLIDKIVSQALM
jgi:hypothetical protein